MRRPWAASPGTDVRPDAGDPALDEADLGRRRTMAERAAARELDLWAAAGIGPGASVLDLGCGPGAFLPTLCALVAPTGRVLGVDADRAAVARAEALVLRDRLRTRIVQADAAATGLRPGSFDVVFIRSVLVHNGPRVAAILAHVRELLGPRGRVVCAEPDLDGIDFGEHDVDRELQQRWVRLTRADGNDPTLGRDDRLPRLLDEHGFEVVATQARLDRLSLDHSPAWPARDRLVEHGLATADDVDRWGAALAARLAASGPSQCALPLSVAVAEPRA